MGTRIDYLIKDFSSSIAKHSDAFSIDLIGKKKFVISESPEVGKGIIICEDSNLEGNYVLSDLAFVGDDYGFDIGVFRESFDFKNGEAVAKDFRVGKNITIEAVPQNLEIFFVPNQGVARQKVEKKKLLRDGVNWKLIIYDRGEENVRIDQIGSDEAGNDTDILCSLGFMFVFPGKNKAAYYYDLKKHFIAIICAITMRNDNGYFENKGILQFCKTIYNDFLNNRYIIDMEFTFLEQISSQEEKRKNKKSWKSNNYSIKVETKK